jgi:hypothetical protein
MKTTIKITTATNTTFKKDWTPQDFKNADRAILRHFSKNHYLHITDHETPSKPLIIYTLTQFDKVAGLAYTSTGIYAGYWICNGGYIYANENFHFVGFAINTDNEVIGICWDKKENELLIKL